MTGSKGGRPSKFRERCTIAVYLEKSTHDKLREVSGGEPISSYIRRLIEKDIAEKRNPPQ